MSDVEVWLQKIGLEKYAEVFASHDIDLAVLPELTEQDLEKLGLSLGHRRKFAAAAAQLRAISTPSVVGPAPARQSEPPVQEIERRQVTVVFTDLVGSTALADQLDAEDLSGLLRRYREACAEVIKRYDGFVAQYLGDGVLAYFGFPQAQEHAAERAVRAGLDIVEAVGRLQHPEERPLQARVGIATGIVAAGDPAGVGAAGEQTLVGDTPNLAARLQALAAPGSVVVGPTTYRLTGDFFEYSFVGEHEVKGFGKPVPVWKVLGGSSIESRFAAARAAAAGPIVARERELVFLSDSWQRATLGNGHAVLICGEAGMGKSRLLEALAERVREEPHRLLRCQCSPYHRNSVLYPFTLMLRHRADIRPDVPGEDNLLRIDQLLARIGRSSRPARLLLAELLEIPAGDALSPMEMTPSQRKSETLAILEDFLLASLDGAPVLLVLEDAHWSDPTSQALVERLLKRIEKERVLALITYRPEFKSSWADHPQATVIACKQLGQEHCAAIVRHLAGNRPIEESLVREIVARSDGVPLYVEELAKAVLDLQSVPAGAVPSTLQDSLMARLDRLGSAKDVAQIASVIGRQFTVSLLAVIADMGDEELRRALDRLQQSGLIFAAGEERDSNYSFNHSLVQEAAYESVSRSRRKALHERIARHLESVPGAAGESEPALIAHHFSRASDPERSSHFWILAADRSGQRLAFIESIANLNAALAEAERIADSGLRTRRKLDVQLKLGATIFIQSGPQSNEVASALAEAHALAKEVNAGPQLFQATWGLYINAARNRRLDKARVLGDELIAISRGLGDEDLQYEALHHRWGLAYFTGQMSRMLEYGEEGVKRYDSDRHHRFSYVYAGHDPGVCAHCIRALALGIAGRKVKPALDTGLALADSLQHPVTLAFALNFACNSMYITGDLEACREIAEREVLVATKYDFPPNRANGAFMLGAVRTLQGDARLGVAQMEPVFEAALGYGFMGVLPGVIMAASLTRAGRGRDALGVIARILSESATPEMGIFVSELWRMRGELMASADDADLGERHLRTAVRIAAEQGASLFHLRAAVSLARFLAELGRREDARAVLMRAHAEASNDFDGPEIATARLLLSDLG